jgi:hypothetical protein
VAAVVVDGPAWPGGNGNGGGGTTPGDKPAVTVQSLSSPEKMTSGDDTLVQLTASDGGAVSGVKVALNGVT